MAKGKNQHVVKHPDGWAGKGAGGKIRAGNSYGNDPYPPKDKK